MSGRSEFCTLACEPAAASRKWPLSPSSLRRGSHRRAEAAITTLYYLQLLHGDEHIVAPKETNATPAESDATADESDSTAAEGDSTAADDDATPATVMQRDA